MIKRQLYAAPATEVLELRLENSVLTESIVSNSRGDSFTTWENWGEGE